MDGIRRSTFLVAWSAVVLATTLGGCGSAAPAATGVQGNATASSGPPQGSAMRSVAAPTWAPSPSLKAQGPAGTIERPIDLAALTLDTRTITPLAVIDTRVGAYSVISTGRELWVGSPDGLVRIDPDTNTASFIDHDHGAKIVARGANVWRAAYLDDRMTRYDGGSGKVLRRVELPAPLGMSISGPLWVALHNSGEIAQVNESTGAVIRTVKVGTEGASGSGEIIPMNGDIWVVVTDDDSIVQVDARTGKVGKRVDLGRSVCEQAAFAAGAIWLCLPVGDDEPPLVRRFVPGTASLGPVYRFPSSPGSAIVSGGTTWLPTTGGLVGVDSASGVPGRFLRIDAPDLVARYAIRAFDSVWVVCPDGRVLRFDVAAFR
jgi:putative pyrroloquinoline-quinone binding quinoprotein